MRNLFLLALIVPLATAIWCPYTLQNNEGVYNTSDISYDKYCTYCTKRSYVNTTYAQNGITNSDPFIYGTGGDIYTCEKSLTYVKGRFTAYPGLKIESCYWDNCTLTDISQNIECGYAEGGWDPESDLNNLPTPTNTMLCQTNNCFKLSATRPGRFVLGSTVVTYEPGTFYDCGDKYCASTIYPGEDNSAQFTCCAGNRCNLAEAQPTNGASNMFTTSILISVLGVKLFA